MKFGSVILAFALIPLAAFALPIPGPVPNPGPKTGSSSKGSGSKSPGSKSSTPSSNKPNTSSDPPKAPSNPGGSSGVPYYPPGTSTTIVNTTPGTGMTIGEKAAIIGSSIIGGACVLAICYAGFKTYQKDIAQQFGKTVETLSNVGVKVTDARKHAVGAVSNMGSNVVGGVKGMAGGAVAAVSSTGGKVLEGATNLAGSASTAASGAYYKVKSSIGLAGYQPLGGEAKVVKKPVAQDKPYNLGDPDARPLIRKPSETPSTFSQASSSSLGGNSFV